MGRRNHHKKKIEEEEEEEEEDVYEVEAIIGQRIKNGKKQYLLRWKSFNDSDATWEDEDSLNCPELLAEYKDYCETKAKKKVKEKIQQSIIKDAKTIRMKQPEIVISAYKSDGVLYYRVGCKNPNTFLSMPADELRKVKPDLICNFLENKIVVLDEKSNNNV